MSGKKKKGEENQIVPGKFWGSQPVPQSRDALLETEPAGHAIDVEKDPIKDIRQEPYPLPNGFSWHTANIDDEAELTAIYELLRDHYVEDDDNMFRFDYSKEFLRWALQPPGYIRDWHLAVKTTSTGKFVGFITGIPVDINLHGKGHHLCEINFLCVHQKLRANRLAPVLIREITRRVNVTGIFQAVYTAGITIPTPIASCQYWHRSLNPKKLIDCKFSHLKKNMTMARTIRLYQLPTEPETRGLRKLQKADCVAASKLLMNYLAKFKLYMRFDPHEFEHWFLPRDGVMNAYVVEDPTTKEITDLISFYTLPSSVLQHPVHKTLKAAYSWYTVPGKTPLKQLLNDALILAVADGFDVFNCLEIQDNKTILADLKFGAGDGYLQYYMYNWACKPMVPEEVGMVLL